MQAYRDCRSHGCGEKITLAGSTGSIKTQTRPGGDFYHQHYQSSSSSGGGGSCSSSSSSSSTTTKLMQLQPTPLLLLLPLLLQLLLLLPAGVINVPPRSDISISTFHIPLLLVVFSTTCP